MHHQLLRSTLLPLLVAALLPCACSADDAGRSPWHQIQRVEEPITKKFKPDEEWAKHHEQAVYYGTKSRYVDEEEEDKIAIELAQQSGHPEALPMLYADLAGSYRGQGRLEEAIKEFSQAIDALKKKAQPDPFGLAMVENNLGEAYRAAGQFEKSVTTLEEAKSLLPNEQPPFAIIMQNLGMSYAKLDRNGEAEDAFKKGIAVSTGSSLNDPKLALESMYSLSLLYARTKKLGDLSALLDKAIPLSEKTFGSDDSHTQHFKQLKRASANATAAADPKWRSYMDAGIQEHAAKNYVAAVADFEKALDVLDTAALTSPAAAVTLSNLGTNYMYLHEFHKAEESLTKALALYQKYFPDRKDDIAGTERLIKLAKEKQKPHVGIQPILPQLPSSATVRSTPLAVTMLERQIAEYDMHKQFDQSAPLYKKIVEIQEENLGPNDPEIAKRLNALGGVYFVLHRYADAEPVFKRSLAILEGQKAPSKSDLIFTLSGLGTAYEEEGKTNLAEPLFKRALALAGNISGSPDLGTQMAIAGYARLQHRTSMPIGAAQQNKPADLPAGKAAKVLPAGIIITTEKPAATTGTPSPTKIANVPVAVSHPAATTDETLFKSYIQFSAAALQQGNLSQGELFTLKALQEAEKFGPEDPRLAATLTALGKIYDLEGKHDDGTAAFTRSATMLEKALGSDNPQVARILLGLANRDYSFGKYNEAEPLYKRALAIQEKALGPNNSDLAATLKDYARLLRFLRRDDEASKLEARAIAVPGSQKAAPLQTLFAAGNAPEWKKNMDAGMNAFSKGNYSEAVTALSPAVKEAEGFGDHDTRLAISLMSLAGAYDKLGDFSQAEPLYKRASLVFDNAMGPDNQYVALISNALAANYFKLAKFEEAEPLYLRSKAIFEKTTGSNSTQLAMVLNNLSELYIKQGKFAQAEPLSKQALSIWERSSGPENVNVATALNNLGHLNYAQGKYSESESVYKRALEIRERLLGPDDPQVGITLDNLAVLYRDQHRYAEAEALQKRAIAINEKSFGKENPEVAVTLNNLGLQYSLQGKYSEAEQLFKRAIAIDEKALGPEHPEVATSLNNLGAAYSKQGNYRAAESLLKQALASDEKVLGPDHPSVARDLLNLAGVYAGQNKYADGERDYKRAIAIEEKAFGPNHPDLVVMLANYAGLLRKMNNPTEAAKLEARAKTIASMQK